MSPQKEWSLDTVLTQFAAKVEKALHENPMELGSPVRDETVGDLIDMLIKAEHGLLPEVPGWMAIGEDE